jgi:hypothetical protein
LNAKKLDQSQNFQEYLFIGQMESQTEQEAGVHQPQRHHFPQENDRQTEMANELMQDEDMNDMTDDNRFQFKQMFDEDVIQPSISP